VYDQGDNDPDFYGNNKLKIKKNFTNIENKFNSKNFILKMAYFIIVILNSLQYYCNNLN
jgi:hypothetical protein